MVHTILCRTGVCIIIVVVVVVVAAGTILSRRCIASLRFPFWAKRHLSLSLKYPPVRWGLAALCPQSWGAAGLTR
jgi:hypothetical protein